ncbi:D-3-phosphoglycerate dehydrogenase [Actinidia rufa]|uniref:D-3-phosphoglycerate dehydrogenase n=1 Tax=Actinidia rufa TaxID=165716 RepID=A0A7J0DAA2_9ERIC|nr:D-3-phosphoglycerate dehydrogenase [Actinidia rufa]
MVPLVNACFDVQEGVSIEISEAVVGALKAELAPTAVNVPMVPAEVLTELKPFVELAEKFAPDDLDARLLRAMITKGLINPISNVFVKLVSADFTAKQRVEGKVRDGIPHLMRVGTFEVDVILGSILGDENVNVSSMSVERTGQQQQAVMAIGVDEPLCNDTLKRIREVSVPSVEEFVFLKL